MIVSWGISVALYPTPCNNQRGGAAGEKIHAHHITLLLGLKTEVRTKELH